MPQGHTQKPKAGTQRRLRPMCHPSPSLCCPSLWIGHPLPHPEPTWHELQDSVHTPTLCRSPPATSSASSVRYIIHPINPSWCPAAQHSVVGEKETRPEPPQNSRSTVPLAPGISHRVKGQFHIELHSPGSILLSAADWSASKPSPIHLSIPRNSRAGPSIRAP